MRREAVIRIRFITGIVLAFMAVLLVRLYIVQIVHGDEYRETGEGQYVHTVRDLYKRGSIFFTTKDNEKVSAATIKSGYLLAIDPSRIEDAEKTYTEINVLVPLDHDTFIMRASKKDKTYQEIEKQVDEELADKIDALNLAGVKLYKNQWRYYPGKSLSARTVGFIGYDGDKILGKYGLERYYNETLMRDSDHMSVNFFAEIFSNLGELVFDSSDSREGDIVTTIEPTVARTLDRVLDEAQAEWNSAYTGGIIMNPQTGEILALNVVPSFDLNERSGVDIETFRNPLTENVYEMGSIIKPLTVAAGLDAGVITPQSTYYDAGFVTLDDYTIRNYDGRGRGIESVTQHRCCTYC